MSNNPPPAPPPPPPPSRKRHDSFTSTFSSSSSPPPANPQTQQSQSQSPSSTTNLAPQSLHTTFPSSRRPRQPSRRPPAKTSSASFASSPPTPRQQLLLQPSNRLQTALTYLARAAALLPIHAERAARAERLAEKLYRFASPTWSRETWIAEVEKARSAVFEAGKAKASAGRGTDEMDGMDEQEDRAGKWVEHAVAELKREGEEGEFWRDGRDLEGVWDGT